MDRQVNFLLQQRLLDFLRKETLRTNILNLCLITIALRRNLDNFNRVSSTLFELSFRPIRLPQREFAGTCSEFEFHDY